jgi:hypothetical protein
MAKAAAPTFVAGPFVAGPFEAGRFVGAPYYAYCTLKVKLNFNLTRLSGEKVTRIQVQYYLLVRKGVPPVPVC